MKKITLLGLFSAMFYGSIAQAGDMGGSDFCCTAFFAAEGGYTWNSIDGYNFDLVGVGTSLFINSQKSRQQYTGRLAAGMLNLVDDQIGITGELGWGYYGRTTLSPVIGTYHLVPYSLSTQYTVSGFDALLGVAWIQSYFNLSFKAGALFQNMQTDEIATTPLFNDSIGTISTKSNSTAVLPAIKLGAAYNFDSNWSITAAYLLAIGGTPKTTGVLDVDTGRAVLNVNNQNPTMNSFLFGVQYTV